MTPAQTFMARMSAVFGEPRTENPEMFLAEYGRILKKFSPTALELGATNLIQNTTKPFWPAPGIAYAELNRVSAQLAAEARAAMKKPEPVVEKPVELSPENRAMIDQLVRSFRTKMLGENVPKAPEPLPPAQRETFEAMQRNSQSRPSGYLHQSHKGGYRS